MQKKKLIIVIICLIVVINIIGYVKYHNKDNNIWNLYITNTFKKDDVLNKGVPVLLDVGRSDCTSCQSMVPDLIKLNTEMKNKIIIKFVDFNINRSLQKDFIINVTPTQFFYDANGKLLKVHEGTLTYEEIINIFKELGYKYA